MSKFKFFLTVFFLPCFSIAQIVPIGSDSTLDIATWNVEWLGSTGYGPSNEPLQLQNVTKVIDNSKLDVIALQEVSDATAWASLKNNLPNYKGAISTWSQTQKTALLYNKDSFTFIYQRHILALWELEFGNGRLPLEVALQYRHQGKNDTLYFFVLHMKANTGNTAEKKLALANREAAGKALREFLVNQYKGKKYIVIGDWNDDADVSILTSNPSPYLGYVQDTNNFFFVTELLSKIGKSSTTSYSQMIDHICLAKSLKTGFTSQSSTDVWKVNSFISSYSSTTSDHYPVYCRLSPNLWKNSNLNAAITKPILQQPIYWDGTQLIVPVQASKIGFYNLQGKKLNAEKLPANQIIAYQVAINGYIYSGTFIK